MSLGGSLSSVLATAKVVLEGDLGPLENAFTQAQQRLEAVGSAMTKIGTDLSLKVTAPIALVGAESFHAAADFDASMRKVAALTSSTEKQVDGWRDTVRQMGVQYGLSGKDAADALYFITSAGLTGDKAIKTLDATLKGAAIGLGDTGVLAHAATSAMNAYSKSGMTATRALEILAGGIKSSNFSIAELAPNLGRVTGMAAAMNIPLEQVVGTLAVFGHTGTDAAEATTQLSSVLGTLLEHNAMAVKSLTAHGLSLANLRKEAAGPNGLIEVMRHLDQAYKGQLDELRVIIPNIRAFRGVMNALSQDGKFVDSIMRDTADSVGLLDRAYAKSQGPLLAYNQAKAKLKDSLIEVGNVLIPVVVPAITAVANAVQGLSQWFSHLNPDTRNLIMGFAALAASLGPVLFISGGLIKVLGVLPFARLLMPITQLTMGFRLLSSAAGSAVFTSGISGAFSAAAVAGTGFRGVVSGLIPTMTSFGAALLPVAAELAVFSTIGLVVVKWMEMKAAVAETAQAMKDATAAQSRMFAETKPADAAKEALGLTARITKITAQLTDSTHYLSAEQQSQLELERVGLIKVRNQLMLIAQSAKDVAAATPAAGGGINVWAEESRKALTKLSADLKTIEVEQAAVGASFNVGEKSAHLYDEAIRKLTEEGVPLNAVLDGQGTTLRKLVERMASAEKQSEAFRAAQEEMRASLTRARDAIKGAQTAEDTYQVAVGDLTLAFLHGEVSLVDYYKGLNNVGNALQEGSTWLQNARDIVNASLTPQQRLAKSLDDVQLAYQSGKISLDQYNQALVYLHALMDDGNVSLQRAKSLVESALTPQERYVQAHTDLSAALATGRITQGEFDEALKHAADTMNGVQQNAHALKEALTDMASKGIDAVVEFAVTGKSSFSSFIKSAIADITKLLVKAELMKLIFPDGTAGGSIFKSILGFANGGFLAGGTVGLVGEQGPELISAGSAGLTVTPMEAMGVAGGGSGHQGGGVNVTFAPQISAIGPADTARFFETNQPYVAGALTRMVQRSSALQRRLGGSRW